MPKNPEQYTFPVWGTQGGGLAKEVSGGRFEFVEAPNPRTGLDVGDEVPEEWGLEPANDLAQDELDDFTTNPSR